MSKIADLVKRAERDVVLPSIKISERVRQILENPERYLSLLRPISFLEGAALYLDEVKRKGFPAEEGSALRDRYTAFCGGVIPEERHIVVAALSECKASLARRAKLALSE